MTAATILRTIINVGENAFGAIALKSSLAMLAALLLLALTRRASASLRHLLVASTFGVLLFLPLASRLVPERVVTVKADAPVVIKAVEAPATPAVVAGQPVSRTLSFADMTFRIYVGVAGLLFASLLVGVGRVYWMYRNAEVSVAGTRLANEVARAEGMRTGIIVSISPELAVPITFGRIVLLPAATSEWNDEELARAIRHELEHISRGDWTTQIVSRLACALYWPHPFVWVLWRRLRLEAERACDDAVIRSRGGAESYAEQLVTLARRLVGRGSVPALSMATRSNLGVRIEAILDARRRRSPLSRFGSLSISVIAIAAMLTVAPVKLMSAALDVVQDEETDEEDADPLDEALLKASERGDVARMRTLIGNGARANAAISGDGSPLIAAARRGKTEAIELLVIEGADVNRGVSGDGNPLTMAAANGHIEAVRLLLDRGARIDAGVEGDGNALIMASGAGHLEIVRFLLDRGASIEHVVNGDENPLIHASEGGQAEVVRYLITRGANVNARVWAEFGDPQRGEWRTPLSMARKNGHQEVVDILIAAGAK
jgi:beta-lactamase regulating signal transducer with metallopeptidase domain